ncbi:MAG TPA: hypothetical protein VGH77_05980 [Streptosporangiaceae bacterium]
MTEKNIATCVTCGTELHPERAKKYNYCMSPECQAKNLKGLTMVAVGVNKSAEQYLLLDDETKAELADGKYHDQRRGTFGRAAPAPAPPAPAQPTGDSATPQPTDGPATPQPPAAQPAPARPAANAPASPAASPQPGQPTPGAAPRPGQPAASPQPGRPTPGAAPRPGQPAATRAVPTRPAGPRQPGTPSQRRLAVLYNQQGLRPDEIARKLGLTRYEVTQIILAARSHGKP